MSIYTGLDPAKALQKWYQLHHTSPDQLAALTPEERTEAQTPGGMVTLAQENPAAWQLVKTGTPAVNDKRQVFNPMTGEFEDQSVRGLYSHWETWAQIIGGGILGGFAAAPLVAGAGTTAPATAGGVDAATVGAGTGVGVEGAGGVLASTSTVPLATGTVTGGTGLTAGTGAGVGLAGAGGAFDAAGNFIGTSTYDIPADVAGGRTYADLLRYGLPVAGNLAGSLITANATSNASAAQQKYLEEALAYAKENDLYNRGVAADKVKLEAARYGDYQGRIGPFIANGTSSNDRMAQLLGLPARPASTSPGGVYSSYGAATPTGVAVSPALTQRILDNYKTLGLTPTGPGSGPTDTAYYADKYAETGGDTAANNAYWFGPGGRIATDAQKAGIAFTPTPTPAAPSPSLAARAPIQPKAARVPVRAPDGSVSHVPADQLDYYTQRGATVLGTAV